jgi:hypothetical protein
MDLDKEQTAVLFRISKAKTPADVFALFPYIPGTVDASTCMSYQHLGQHSAADYEHCIKGSRPATPKEYATLAAELKSIGYNLRIINSVGNRRLAMQKRKANV